MPGTPHRNRTYASWYDMMKRCSDPSEPQCADMGDRPVGMTLERADNDGGYDLNNCRWATRAEQQRNRRNTIRVAVGGVAMCLKDACTSRAHYLAIRRRMTDFGMTFETAIADRGWA